ncbi:MAG: hypothetical protein JTT11_08640 [Candidatus Brockarchaeota archaeon]|nr:hypothetical protein [Candidatus Brockarchaeota archaeon]
MTVEVKAEKVNWPVWIVFIFVLNLLANMISGTVGILGQFFGCIYGLGPVSIPFTMPVLALILPILTYPLGFLGQKFSKTTLARLYVVGLVSSMAIGNFNDAWMSWPVGSSNRVWASPPEYLEVLRTLWWVPPRETVLRMRTGGVAPDFAAWFPAIMYCILFQSCFFILSSGLMLLFRRRWIEVERVPYPFAVAIWEGTSRISERKFGIPFLIGTVAGLLLNFQIMMAFLFPWWPDLLGWRTLGVSPNGCVNTTGTSVDPIGTTLVAWMKTNLQPINYAMAFLIPLDVLFTAWVLWVLFMILAQIAYTFGYYTGALSLSGCCRVLIGAFETSPTWGPPLYWSWMPLTGGMLGFVIMLIWHSRDYLKETIMAAQGKAAPEVQANEPLSYRTIYMVIGAGLVAVFAFMLSLQANVAEALLVTIFGGVIYAMAESYMRGLTGAAFAQERSKWSHWPLRLLYSNVAPTPYTAGFFSSAVIFARGNNTASGGVSTWAEVSMHSFRVADLSGSQPRDLYRFVVLTFIFAIPITMFVRVWWYSILGDRLPWCTSGWDCGDPGRAPFATSPPMGDIAMAGVAGFIIVTVLSVLRARYVWFPLNPAGFLIQGAAREVWTGCWNVFLAAWVAKFLVLRIGGSKLYTEKGVPVASGVIFGFTICVIVGVIVGLIRWFFPF